MSRSSVGEERLLRGYTGRIFVLITVTFIAVKTGQRLLPPLLPLIVEDLHLTAAAAGLALSLMEFMRALLQYPSGRYADQLSRKTVLLTSLGLAVCGFVLIAATPVELAFFLGIVVIGAAVGLWDPADRALVSDLFHEKRGRAFGFHLMGSDVSGMLAAVMATLVAAATWRLAFFPPLVVLLPGTVLIFLWVREPLRFDWVPLDVRSTGFRLLEDTYIRGSLVIFTLIVFAIQGITGFLPIFLIEVHDFSFGLASLSFGLLYATGIVIRPITGGLSDVVPRLAVVSGLSFLGGAGVMLLVFGTGPAVVIAGVIGYAIGNRGFGPPLQAYLMDKFPDDSMAGDIGAIRATYTVIGSGGPAFVGFTAEGLGLRVAFAAMVGLFVAAGLVSTRLLLLE